ncbi:hypothetical protein PLICRDRAFT_29770 [Plicaturopsis crispa FD-325 SS-3]|nr:hypothetical protein PLICRDRAFT_29770 [Plicaturopsis crispa FD-325 SS-3]
MSTGYPSRPAMRRRCKTGNHFNRIQDVLVSTRGISPIFTAENDDEHLEDKTSRLQWGDIKAKAPSRPKTEEGKTERGDVKTLGSSFQDGDIKTSTSRLRIEVSRPSEGRQDLGLKIQDWDFNTSTSSPSRPGIDFDHLDDEDFKPARRLPAGLSCDVDMDLKMATSRQDLLIGTGTWPGEGRQPQALRPSPPLDQDRIRADLRGGHGLARGGSKPCDQVTHRIKTDYGLTCDEDCKPDDEDTKKRRRRQDLDLKTSPPHRHRHMAWRGEATASPPIKPRWIKTEPAANSTSMMVPRGQASVR